jgi:fructosamine-3-kinase
MRRIMDDSLHPLRIENIKNSSVPFPLFFVNESDDIIQAMYISEIHEMNAMLVPEGFTITKESASGMKTTAVYQLVEALKTDDYDDFDPQDN